MLGGSQNYTLRLDDNSIYIINVKRPQFLITSLKRRTAYLYSLSENNLGITRNIVNDYNINTFVDTLFAICSIRKIKDLIEKLKSLIEITINTGVNSTREEMHIIGLQILVNNIIFKITTDYLQAENERLNALLFRNKSSDNEFHHTKKSLTFTPKLDAINEGHEDIMQLKKKSIRKKLLHNRSQYSSKYVY
jgi:hypothetical protein